MSPQCRWEVCTMPSGNAILLPARPMPCSLALWCALGQVTGRIMFFRFCCCHLSNLCDAVAQRFKGYLGCTKMQRWMHLAKLWKFTIVCCCKFMTHWESQDGALCSLVWRSWGRQELCTHHNRKCFVNSVGMSEACSSHEFIDIQYMYIYIYMILSYV